MYCNVNILQFLIIPLAATRLDYWPWLVTDSWAESWGNIHSSQHGLSQILAHWTEGVWVWTLNGPKATRREVPGEVRKVIMFFVYVPSPPDRWGQSPLHLSRDGSHLQPASRLFIFCHPCSSAHFENQIIWAWDYKIKYLWKVNADI